MRVLIPNIGSTSFKYRLLEIGEAAAMGASSPAETVLAQGRVERIGQPGGECADCSAAIRKCLSEIAGPGKALQEPGRDWGGGVQGGSCRAAERAADH